MSRDDDETPGDDGTRAELERQIERGHMFTHTEVSRNAARINELEAFVYGLIDLLAAAGVVPPKAVAAAAKRVGIEMAEKSEARIPRIAMRIDSGEETAPPPIDCAARLHICKAACCRLDFALSQDELENGPAKWDLGRPYFIRHDADGYCCHIGRPSMGCGIYDQRPAVCRKFTCEGDKRIWKDFDAMELNTEWLEQHLVPEAPRVIERQMQVDAKLASPAEVEGPED